MLKHVLIFEDGNENEVIVVGNEIRENLKLCTRVETVLVRRKKQRKFRLVEVKKFVSFEKGTRSRMC